MLAKYFGKPHRTREALETAFRDRSPIKASHRAFDYECRIKARTSVPIDAAKSVFEQMCVGPTSRTTMLLSLSPQTIFTQVYVIRNSNEAIGCRTSIAETQPRQLVATTSDGSW